MGGGVSHPVTASATSTSEKNRLDWISRIPCFQTLSPKHLNQLSGKISILTFKKDEKIITQGGTGSLFGILVSGSVSISATAPSGSDVILCKQDPGFFFGEAAIIGNTTTTATITANEPCIVFGLRSRELQQLAIQLPEVKESLLSTVSHRLKQNLLAIPFFAQLQQQLEKKKMFKVLGAFDLLSTLFEVDAVDAKTTIFKAGDIGDKLYIICEGCVRISSEDSDGNNFMLAMLTKNDVFGEIALLEHTNRTATARAFEPSLLLTITKKKFDKLYDVFPEFCDTMKPLLAHRTANTLKNVDIFCKLEIEKRELLGGLMEFKGERASERAEASEPYSLLQ